MLLIRITEENFEDYWKPIEPLLRGCCERSNGRFSVETSLEALRKGNWQFWVGIDEKTRVKLFGTSEILIMDTGLKVLNVIFVTGSEMKSWVHLIDEVGLWGKAQGCSIIQALARPGWQKILKDWTLTHVLLERGL